MQQVAHQQAKHERQRLIQSKSYPTFNRPAKWVDQTKGIAMGASTANYQERDKQTHVHNQTWKSLWAHEASSGTPYPE